MAILYLNHHLFICYYKYLTCFMYVGLANMHHVRFISLCYTCVPIQMHGNSMFSSFVFPFFKCTIVRYEGFPLPLSPLALLFQSNHPELLSSIFRPLRWAPLPLSHTHTHTLLHLSSSGSSASKRNANSQTRAQWDRVQLDLSLRQNKRAHCEQMNPRHRHL